MTSEPCLLMPRGAGLDATLPSTGSNCIHYPTLGAWLGQVDAGRDRDQTALRARYQPRSATTAGYFPFATCARRGLRKGTAMKYEDTIEIRGVTVPPFLIPGREHGRVVPSAPRQGRHPQTARHEPGAGMTSMDRYSLLRERMFSLRGSRLLLLGIL